MANDLMKIGELAKQAGINHRTAHYYEAKGLITPAARSDGNHRMYNSEAVARLQKIIALKKLGLSLNEISEVIDLYFLPDNGMIEGKKRVVAILKEQLAKVDSQIDELSGFRSDLIKNIKHMESLYQEALDNA